MSIDILPQVVDILPQAALNPTLPSHRLSVPRLPQGSVLGPLLFNIFINDMIFFLKRSRVCNFADDNTLYATSKQLHEVLASLELDVGITLDWFETNFMVANPFKFQIMFLGLHQPHKLCLEINNQIVPSSDLRYSQIIGHRYSL